MEVESFSPSMSLFLGKFLTWKSELIPSYHIFKTLQSRENADWNLLGV